MANIKLPRKEFEKATGKLDEKMQHKIAMFGTPLENLGEQELEIEIFPNRPDLLSLQGYLRSFLVFLGKKSRTYKLHKPETNYEVKIDRSVSAVRPFTACAIVKNLKFTDEKIKEIIDIQEKLHTTIGRNRKKVAIGIYPLEAIKLPITYKAIPPAQIRFIPLEQEREMTGNQILSSTQTGREYAHLLSGKSLFPVFIDSNNEVLSMPPIINSHKTGKVTEKTKAVFIECSGFDLNTLQKVLNILVTTLADFGGQIYQMKLRYPKTIITPDLTPEKIKINIQDCNKLLGLNLKEQEVKKLLMKMGYEYKSGLAHFPCYRTDILHPVDIYEDVAIAYGYDNFIPELPKISGIGEENKKEIFYRKIRELLIGLSLLETSSYHLTTKDALKNMNLKSTNIIEVENSKTDYSFLRPNLLSNQLKILSENVDSEYPQNIFEIGKIFKQEKEIKEQTNLCITKTPGNFTELKQVLQYLEQQLNLKFTIAETTDSSFIEGRIGEILLNNKKIGIIGEIHPQILKNWHLKMPVSVIEICIDELI